MLDGRDGGDGENGNHVAASIYERPTINSTVLDALLRSSQSLH